MSNNPSPQMHLNLFFRGVGYHEAAWRHPTVDPVGVWNPEHYVQSISLAEKAKFDSVFLGDNLNLFERPEHDVPGRFEPLTLFSYVAAHTERIGLCVTASTGFTEPFNLARLFQGLDFVSRGRAAWNMVTTAGDRSAQNFGREVNTEHDLRYEQAAEYVDVVRALWDSWGDKAVLADKATGRYADPDEIQPINHVGKHFSVRGPGMMPRSPQRYPVLFQAGASEAGKDFAAKYADCVFNIQQSMESAVAFVTEMRKRVVSHGRNPSQVKILPGIIPYVGSTEEEGRALKLELDNLIVPETSLKELSRILQVDLTRYDYDGPVPELPLPTPSPTGARSRSEVIYNIVKNEKPTVRQLVHRVSGGRGHIVVVGSAEQVADHLQQWFEAGAADGFNVAPPILPVGLELFVEQVVPILRQRGLFREEYTGTTLRDHLGLNYPRDR